MKKALLVSLLSSSLILSACSLKKPNAEVIPSPSPESSPVASPLVSPSPSPSPVATPQASVKPSPKAGASTDTMIKLFIANGCAIKDPSLSSEQMRSIGLANMKKFGVTQKEVTDFSAKLYGDSSYATINKQITDAVANCK